MFTVEKYRSKLNRLRAHQRLAVSVEQREQQYLAEAEQAEADAVVAQQILQQVAQQIQQQAHHQIAAVVTRCLQAVFGDEAYEFKIDFQQKRGKTEAAITLIRNGHEVSPRSGVGGGVQDVISFSLRLACLLLRRPRSRKLIVMDEPFRFVHSSVYRERVRLLLETLSQEMDFQFIMSTGIDDLRVGKVIEL